MHNNREEHEEIDLMLDVSYYSLIKIFEQKDFLINEIIKKI